MIALKGQSDVARVACHRYASEMYDYNCKLPRNELAVAANIDV